jgi:hypothetical protein
MIFAEPKSTFSFLPAYVPFETQEVSWPPPVSKRELSKAKYGR